MKTLSLICCTMLCALLLSSCDRDPIGTHVAGRILDFGTLAPVAGAKVYLQESTHFAGSWTNRDVDSLVTGADGAYSFDIATDEFIALRVVSDKHYPWEFSGTWTGTDGTVIDSDIILDPKAWLKLHIKNVNPLNDFDLIDYDGIAPVLTGTSVDTIIVSEWAGNRDVLQAFLIRRGGVNTLIEDTIYLPAYDTTFYEMLY